LGVGEIFCETWEKTWISALLEERTKLNRKEENEVEEAPDAPLEK
jgi:hypothetical protein